MTSTHGRRRRRGGSSSSQPAGRPEDHPPARVTTRTEIGVYGLLAGAVATAVILAAGLPTWYAIAAMAGAVVLVAVVTIAGPKPTRQGRRRRRH